MTNTFRALCSELADALLCWQSDGAWIDQAEQSRLIARARTALAEQPEGPTDEALVQLAFREKLGRLDSNGNIITRYYYPMDIGENVIAFARAVLARWGAPAAAPEAP